MEQEEEAKRLDSPVMKIFLFSCGFFFLFWFLSLIFQTENFWNILGFESKVASFVYFVISLVVFMIVYSQTKKGNVNNLLNKIYSSKKATLILVAITIAIIVFYTASLKIGENWATLIIRSITGLCAGGPLQALQFKYFTSSPLASSVGVLVGQIGLALKVNTLVSLKILSKIIGIIFVFVAYYFVRKHYPKQTFPTLFIILFSIGIASFLGVAGHVNFIGIVFILLYFGSAYLCLKNKANIIVPSVLLAMSMLSHLSTGFFLPSLLYLLVHDKINFKKGTINKRIFKDLLFVIVGLAIPYLIFYAAVQIDVSQQGFNVLDLGAGDLPNEGNGFAPLTKAGVAKYGAHYTMFAPLHFIDFLSFSQLMNAFKFIFVLLAAIILFKHLKKDKIFNFLGIACLFISLYVFTVHNDLTPRVNGWETYVFMILPFSLLTIKLIFDYVKNTELRTRIISLAIILLIITLIPWMTMLSQSDAYKGQSSLAYRAATQGSLKGNILEIKSETIKVNKDLKIIVSGLGGFCKDAQGQYGISLELVVFQKGKKVLSHETEMNPQLIRDIPGKNIGEISQDIVFAMRMKDIPPGETNAVLVVQDDVSKAKFYRYYSFEIVEA